MAESILFRNSSSALKEASSTNPFPVTSSGDVASGATDSGNPVKVAGVYNTVAPTLTNGQRGDLQVDSSANLKVTQATKIAGEDLTYDVMKSETQTSYSNISASALVKTGAGRLSGWVVNSASAGATIKFWDNTSAATTVLLNTMTYTAAVNQGPSIATIPGAAVKFNTGLYCTISGTADITILYN